MKKVIIWAILIALLCVPLSAGATQTTAPHTEFQSQADMLELKLGDHGLWEWGEEYLLCQVMWNSLLLGEEDAQRFPNLALTLEKMNLDKLLAMQEEMAWMLPIAQDVSNEYMHCTSESRYQVQRSDSAILSIRENVYAFTGGAHPNTGVIGINFDCASGKELKLSDVVTDTGRVLEIISDALNKKYELGEFMDVDEALGMLTEDELEWTMNHQGLTFHFGPGMIAPYAAGLMNVTIWYDEYEELFHAEYLPPVQIAYAVELPLFETVELDLVKGDGKRDELMISAYMDAEGYAYEQLVITVNGESLNMPERYSYSLVPYLVTVSRGKDASASYICVQESSDNDYRTLSLFELKADNVRFITEIPGSGFASVWDEEREAVYTELFNDPADFRLATRLDILGTMTGVRSYSIDGSSGYFTAQENYYDVSDAQMQVVSVVPIEVTMLDDSEKTVMPAGTTFTFLRTDGCTYMETRLEDGKECRIDVRTDDEMMHWIGELPDWECFEEVFYAG